LNDYRKNKALPEFNIIQKLPMSKLATYISLGLKGAGMGAANVIPGVSGGTVALITGIFEKLIDSIKSFNIKAVRLLIRGKFKECNRYVNLDFLLAVFIGAAASIISLAKLLEFLFLHYPIYIWAYFFGLILASVYFVGRTVSRWNTIVVVWFLVGTAAAVIISVMNPATENQNFFYLMLCGVVAICSMILPGLSGSFVLILMGNYKLVAIEAITNVRMDILLPVAIGAAGGLVAFSHLLSWVYKKFRNITIALLTGFILGSLIILWPWKNAYNALGNVIPTNDVGAYITTQGTIAGDVKVFSYEPFIPSAVDGTVVVALILMVAGIISIWAIEKFAQQQAG
jgi:putative membrane protein